MICRILGPIRHHFWALYMELGWEREGGMSWFSSRWHLMMLTDVWQCEKIVHLFQCLWPILAKTGSNKAKNTANILSDFEICLGFSMYSFWFFGFKLFPNCELRIPDGFQYFLEFSELPKMWPNVDSKPLIYWNNISTNLYCSILVL